MAEEKAPEQEEYELLPHREIEELKDELAKLKEFEIAPSKRLQVSLLELNTKLDKLITIFEDASHELRIEEGGLSFTEKMRPVLEKMNKVLEQNSEIASGILALADMVKDIKGEQPELPKFDIPKPAAPGPMPVPSTPRPPVPPAPGMPKPSVPHMAAPPVPPKAPPGVPPGQPLPPIPPKKRTFGL